MKWFLILSFIASAVFAQGFNYPKARFEKHFEKKFNKLIFDPYKWMENEHDPALGNWLAKQNELVEAYLSQTASDQKLQQELHNEFSQIFYPETPGLIDGIALMKDQMETLKDYQRDQQKRFSPSGENNFNLGLKKESEKYTTKIMNETGNDLQRVLIIRKEDKEVIETVFIKFGEIVVWEDDETFIYNTDRDARIGDRHTAVYRHKVGTPQSEDEIVYRSKSPREWAQLQYFQNEPFILINPDYDYSNPVTIVKRVDLENKKIFESFRFTGNLISITKNRSSQQILSLEKTNISEGAIYSYDTATATKRMILPPQSFVMSEIKLKSVGNTEDFFLKAIDDVENSIYRVTNGKVKKISFPTGGSLNFEELENNILTVSFESYTQPNTTYSYNLETKEVLKVEQKEAPIEIKLKSKKLHYIAHNGQKAALWLVSRDDIQINETTPTLLYGYGGFDVNILPRYPSEILPFLKRGGVYAVATLPGGGEYGEQWHRAGAKHNKENVFTDFKNAANFLISNKMTSPQKLAINGGSNGGLLVSATMQRYPKLFSVAVPQVGVQDMVNFHKFTGGKWWQGEYGNADEEKDFLHLLKISPYHSLVKGKYPATLVMTADFDDRVVAMHSYKYAAKLQQMQDPSRPAFLHIKNRGSHSSRSGGRKKRINTYTTKWSFIIKNLFMN